MAVFPAKGFKIGDLSIPLPIVQGGMGVGISLAGLASAVANEGGIGVLSAAGIGQLYRQRFPGCGLDNCQALQKELQRARQMTNGVLGVNIMVALSDFEPLSRAAVEAGADIIFAGAGLPLELPACRPSGSRTKLVPIVSSAKAVRLIGRWWREKHQTVPDAFVLEGPMAGGHLGFRPNQLEDPAFRLEALIPPVLAEIRTLEQQAGRPIPLIAGGGVFTGGDIRRILSLGASAVQMATRFVATDECDADPAFKQAYVACTKEQIGIIQSPVGLPGRAIVGDFLQRAQAGQTQPAACPYHCITTCQPEKSPYCISLALLNACKGDLEKGFCFIGANGWRVQEVVPVHTLIRQLAAEYEQSIQTGEVHTCEE